MQNAKQWIKPLLGLHLFVCLTWLYLFWAGEPRDWAVHVFLLSILAVQFTWGFTIGLIVGPARKDRSRLWWSLLTVFMPVWLYSKIAVVLCFAFGPIIALLYLLAFVAILACETYGGILLGAKLHSGDESL